jgi:hypothetical protein
MAVTSPPGRESARWCVCPLVQLASWSVPVSPRARWCGALLGRLGHLGHSGTMSLDVPCPSLPDDVSERGAPASARVCMYHGFGEGGPSRELRAASGSGDLGSTTFATR